jgi:aryl-alcohol dehydrogenase-like predicted oxidoreductase
MCPLGYATRADDRRVSHCERLSAIQLEYSLAQRNIEKQFMPLGAEHGIGIMAWSPLVNGLLSGYIPSE